jgi:hypothetical protein
MKTEIIHIGKMLTELVTQAQHIDSELTDYLLQAKNRTNKLKVQYGIHAVTTSRFGSGTSDTREHTAPCSGALSGARKDPAR